MVYKSGLVQHLTLANSTDLAGTEAETSPFPSLEKFISLSHKDTQQTWAPDVEPQSGRNDPEPAEFTATRSADMAADSSLAKGNRADYTPRKLHHTEPELWRHLSHNHWPTLLGYYNISLPGRYCQNAWLETAFYHIQWSLSNKATLFATKQWSHYRGGRW